MNGDVKLSTKIKTRTADSLEPRCFTRNRYNSTRCNSFTWIRTKPNQWQVHCLLTIDIFYYTIDIFWPGILIIMLIKVDTWYKILGGAVKLSFWNVSHFTQLFKRIHRYIYRVFEELASTIAQPGSEIHGGSLWGIVRARHGMRQRPL